MGNLWFHQPHYHCVHFRPLLALTQTPPRRRNPLAASHRLANTGEAQAQPQYPGSTNPHWTDNLPVATANKVKSFMTELLRPKDHGTPVLLSFVPPYGAGAPGTGEHIISYLKEAIGHRYPPLVQYMNEEYKPVLNYSLPTIEGIDDGMYVIYSTKTLADGKMVRDVAGRKTYRTIDLRYNWNAILENPRSSASATKPAT